MKRTIAMTLCAAMAATGGAGCAGTFGSVGRTTRISDSSRITAGSIVPDDEKHRNVIEHLALAEEIYGKTLDALRDRRGSLRARRRTLTLATYATFAVTTLVIGAAAISSSGGDQTMGDTDEGLRTAGYGALAGLGLGTTLEVVNLMQEDPANVEAKIGHLQSSYDNMVERLRELFEHAERDGLTPQTIEVRAGTIIETFINEALQINVKG